MPIRRRRPRLHFASGLWVALLPLSVALIPSRAVPAASPVPAFGVDVLAERVRTKVVCVDVQVGAGGRAGTGFFAAPGHVLTNEHVIRDADAITVWSNGVPYRARVIDHDTGLDLALLALPDAALLIKPLPLAAASSTLPGEPVLIVGSHPAPTAAAVRQSLVTGLFRGMAWLALPAHRTSGTLELSAQVEPGDSGSPVLRLRDGAVIGVVRARDTPAADGFSPRAWAVPIDVAFPLLRGAGQRTLQAYRPSPDEEFYLRRP